MYQSKFGKTKLQSASFNGQSLRPHTCEYCQKIVLDWTVLHNRLQDTPRSKDEDFSSQVLIETGDLDFLEASRQGCLVCEWLLDLRPDAWPDGSCLTVSVKWDSVLFQWQKTWGEKRFKHYTHPYSAPSGRLQASIPSDDSMDDQAQKNPFLNNSRLPFSFQQARGWLDTCRQYHPECAVRENEILPTRLIKIDQVAGRWKLCLQETRGESPVQYTALSYCWGANNQPMITTQASLAQRHSDIPFDDLPKTIQDAISATWEVRMHHLWVDALCIVQDLPSDVEQEIARMQSIYGDASLVLIASKSDSVHQGFLGSEETPSKGATTFCLRCSAPDRRRRSIFLSVASEPLVVREPLSIRAWGLQERVLARRVLDFDSLGTWWNCKAIRTPSDNWGGAPVSKSVRGSNDKYRDIVPAMLPMEDLGYTDSLRINRVELHPRARALRHWKLISDVYMSLLLTKEVDRCYAVSGIAEQFGRFFKDQYLAGLWAFAFPWELLWLSKDNSPLKTRPEHYTGPSWSWIGFGRAIESWKPPYEGASLKLISQNITLNTESAPYGAVTAGELILEGQMRTIEWKHNAVSDTYSAHFPILEKRGIDLFREGMQINMDFLEDWPSSEHSFGLPSYLLEVGTDLSIGLVLRKHSDERFSRVGTYDLGKSGTSARLWGWREMSETVQITLI